MEHFREYQFEKADFVFRTLDLALDLYAQHRDKRFSVEGVETVLGHAEKCFTEGKIS